MPPLEVSRDRAVTAINEIGHGEYSDVLQASVVDVLSELHDLIDEHWKRLKTEAAESSA